MANQIVIAATFVVFLVLFIVVGIYSAKHQQKTTTDYLLASRNVNPWLIALSAMATERSGQLFIGGVGFTYMLGLSTVWVTVGWVIGDYLAWWFVFRRLRTLSEASASDTVSSFLGQNQKGGDLTTIVSALITIAFLSFYAAAQLIAGSKALNAVFGWNYYLGVIVGAVIVVIYCFSGGIRASIWTDAVQAVLMLGCLLLLFVAATISGGGLAGLWNQLYEIDPALVSLEPAQLQFGMLPFLISWGVGGFGVVGQPHIVVRAMAIKSPNSLILARNIKLASTIAIATCAIGVGLASRALLPELATSGDPELALPYLAIDLLPVVLVGMMLAGLFAATISTADSQILSCSAALTQDLFPAMAHSYRYAKLGTLTVTAIILAVALTGSDNVFRLITFSWSSLASGLGPLLVVRSLQQPVSVPVAVAMMGAGIAAALLWNLGLGLSGAVYEVLPGMAAGTIVYIVAQFRRPAI
ncbi:MAG: sodium/proline symporter [Cyanophyceae cyanobacterium]